MEQQTKLFPDVAEPSSRTLPLLGEQKDIRYYGATARGVLNGPATTGMGYWSINPYVGCAFGCAYCYARYAHRYVMERAAAASALEDGGGDDTEAMPPWLAFERRVFVKENAPELVRKALRQSGDKFRALVSGEETLVIGTATDPYQPAERRFRVTRGVLEVLAECAGLSVVIITKSPLVTRDVDVLARIAARSSLSVHVSLITLRRDLARRLEPRAPTPESRVRAVARLAEAGVKVGVNVMPVLPGITDHPADLEALVSRVAAAGAARISACALRLQRTARERYLPFIAQEFPHLAERYGAAYATSYKASERYRVGLDRFFRRLSERVGIRFGHEEADEEEGSGVRDEGRGDDAGAIDAAPAQMELGL